AISGGGIGPAGIIPCDIPGLGIGGGAIGAFPIGAGAGVAPIGLGAITPPAAPRLAVPRFLALSAFLLCFGRFALGIIILRSWPSKHFYLPRKQPVEQQLQRPVEPLVELVEQQQPVELFAEVLVLLE